jgi:hypothetical protein
MSLSSSRVMAGNLGSREHADTALLMTDR